VKLLFDRNARMTAHCVTGEKLIDAARRNRHFDIVDLLQ